MWWLIGIGIALVLFICWMVWEVLHAPVIDFPPIGSFMTIDDEDDEDEQPITDKSN